MQGLKSTFTNWLIHKELYKYIWLFLTKNDKELYITNHGHLVYQQEIN